MRVKVLIVLAIASVLLLCSAGVATASILPASITGIPTTSDLEAAAFQQADQDVGAYGFPDVDNVGATTLLTDEVAQDSLDSTCLETPICGVCGQCPPCSCEDTLTTFAGPEVNLACPVVNVEAEPVCLESPEICPEFDSINVAPQATLVLPQVNAKLNCFDISCFDCGSDCGYTPRVW